MVMCFDTSLKKLLEGVNLKREEAFVAMAEIMSGSVSDIKLSAWLSALKVKGEVSEEISGCAEAMLKHARKVTVSNANVIDIVGTGGDGAHTINISTASAFVAAGAGISVAKHGNRAVSSKSGSADILSALGININLTPEKMSECISKVGISFLFAPVLHPAMKNAVPVRKELGVRTIFNILGPICNPAGVKNAVIGVYSKPLCRQIAEAARALGYRKLFVVHGNDGLDELTITTSTHVCELNNNIIQEYELEPEKLNLSLASTIDIAGGTPEENAEIMKDIFRGKIKGAKRDIVVLNSAAAILVAGKVEDWHQAVKIAERVLDSGKAYGKLQELINFTN